MATKRNSYIDVELEWAETQLSTWKSYIDKHPLDGLVDRIEWKPTSKGGLMPMVIASIESQGKFVQETLKNYLSLCAVVDDLREKEAKKNEKRGGGDIPEMMQ